MLLANSKIYLFSLFGRGLLRKTEKIKFYEQQLWESSKCLMIDRSHFESSHRFFFLIPSSQCSWWKTFLFSSKKSCPAASCRETEWAKNLIEEDLSAIRPIWNSTTSKFDQFKIWAFQISNFKFRPLQNSTNSNFDHFEIRQIVSTG